MGKGTKLLMLALDYKLQNGARKDAAGKINPYTFLTRNLINIAFQQNYAGGMPSNVSKSWRSIRIQLDAAIDDDKRDYVILSESDFDTVYKEVYDCKYIPGDSALAPYFYDELDCVKHRSGEDEEKVQSEMKEFEEKLAHEGFKRDPLTEDEGLKSIPKAV